MTTYSIAFGEKNINFFYNELGLIKNVKIEKSNLFSSTSGPFDL